MFNHKLSSFLTRQLFFMSSFSYIFQILIQCWCDTHVNPPIRSINHGKSISDRHNEQVSFYKDVPEILIHLEERPGVVAASASRTHTPEIAKTMLNLMKINGRPAHTYLHTQAWGTGSKIEHFHKIRQSTGVDFRDMVFFDDEGRNRDVERHLGVTFIHVDEDIGVNWNVFNDGISKWQSNQSS